MGANNDKNHCRITKASDNQRLSKDRMEKTEPKTLIIDLDKDTLTHNPNRPKYFSMQIVNNPSKRDSRAFEKSTKCDHPMYSDKLHNIHKENTLRKQGLYKEKTKQTLT